MIRQFRQVHGTAGCGVGYRRPDSPYPKQCRQPSGPATLQLSDGDQSQGEPVPEPPKGEQDENSPPSCPEAKSFGLRRLLTRLQGQVRGRSRTKSSSHYGVCAMALSRVNKVASWMHALRLARRSNVDGQAAQEAHYNRLRSDRSDECPERPSAAPSVDLSLRTPEGIQDGSR
ncbi:unnamed protein product [Ixodes pacificus]